MNGKVWIHGKAGRFSYFDKQYSRMKNGLKECKRLWGLGFNVVSVKIIYFKDGSYEYMINMRRE